MKEFGGGTFHNVSSFESLRGDNLSPPIGDDFHFGVDPDEDDHEELELSISINMPNQRTPTRLISYKYDSRSINTYMVEDHGGDFVQELSPPAISKRTTINLVDEIKSHGPSENFVLRLPSTEVSDHERKKRGPESASNAKESNSCTCCGMNYGEIFCCALAPSFTVISTGVIETLWAPYIYLSDHDLTALGISMLIYGTAGALSDIIIQRIPHYASQFHSSQAMLTGIGWLMMIVNDKHLLYPAVFLISFGKALTANQTCLYILESDISISKRASIRAQFVSFAWILNFLQFLTLVNFGKDIAFSIIAFTALLSCISTILFYYQTNPNMDKTLEMTLKTMRSPSIFTMRTSTQHGTQRGTTSHTGVHFGGGMFSMTLQTQHAMDFMMGDVSGIGTKRSYRDSTSLHPITSHTFRENMQKSNSTSLHPITSHTFRDKMQNSIRNTYRHVHSTIRSHSRKQHSLSSTTRETKRINTDHQCAGGIEDPDAHSELNWTTLIALLGVVFWHNFLDISYSVSYALVWLDQYNSPDFWVSLIPIVSTATAGFVVSAYQLVSWKIFHDVPYNIFFFVCARVVTLLAFAPGINLPFYFLLAIHWFMIVEFYSFACAELIARAQVGDDLLYINACTNVVVMISWVAGGTLMPILYKMGYNFFKLGITCANGMCFISGLVCFCVLSSKRSNPEKSISSSTTSFNTLEKEIRTLTKTMEQMKKDHASEISALNEAYESMQVKLNEIVSWISKQKKN